MTGFVLDSTVQRILAGVSAAGFVLDSTVQRILAGVDA